MIKEDVVKSPPSSREESLRGISNAWRKIKQRMHVRIGERMRAEQVTSISQCAALNIICAQTKVTVKTVATFLGITSPAATQLVRELESHDLLKKEENPNDSRSTFLCPTATGKRTLAKADKIFCDEFEKLLTPLTDKEVAEYQRLSEKIATYIYEK